MKAPGAGDYPPQPSAPGQDSVAGPGIPPGPARAARHGQAAAEVLGLTGR